MLGEWGQEAGHKRCVCMCVGGGKRPNPYPPLHRNQFLKPKYEKQK
jgi:hypothetical protein